MAAYIYRFFVRISKGRTLEPITWGEILSWSQLADEPLEPWEAEAIKRLDHLFLAAQTDDTKIRS